MSPDPRQRRFVTAGFLPGLILIMIGLIWLGINYGLLSTEFARQLLLYWPVILILFGLRLVMSQTGWFVGATLLIIALSVALAWWNPPRLRAPAASRDRSEASQTLSADRGTIDQMEMTIRTGALHLQLSDLPHSGKLYRGTFNGPRALDIRTTRRDRAANIDISEPSTGFMMPSPRRRLELALAPDIATKLQIATGAADFDLDLGQLEITRLGIEAGASSGHITLGQKAAQLTGQIKLGASSLTLRVPRAAGLRLRVDAPLSSQNIEANGLVQSGNVYESSDYNTQSIKIELHITAGVSSLKLERY